MNAEFESRCEFCKEEVVSLDDYSNHLIIVHNLKASLISNIVERALKPAKNQPEIVKNRYFLQKTRLKTTQCKLPDT